MNSVEEVSKSSQPKTLIPSATPVLHNLLSDENRSYYRRNVFTNSPSSKKKYIKKEKLIQKSTRNSKKKPNKFSGAFLLNNPLYAKTPVE